jgi:hypothetical protein
MPWGYWLIDFLPNTHILVPTTELLLRSGRKCKGRHLNHHRVRICRVWDQSVIIWADNACQDIFQWAFNGVQTLHCSWNTCRQNPKPKTMWLGTSVIALIFILFQPAEKSYLASITWLLKEAQVLLSLPPILQNSKHPLSPTPPHPPPTKKTDQEGCFNFQQQTFWDASSTLQ